MYSATRDTSSRQIPYIIPLSLSLIISAAPSKVSYTLLIQNQEDFLRSIPIETKVLMNQHTLKGQLCCHR